MHIDNSSQSFSFKHFNDIDEDYRKSDLHFHSEWTDGEGTIEDIIEHAKTVGLKRICFTDHIRKGSTYFPDYAREIRRQAQALDFEAYVGFEAKVMNFDGEIDVSAENLEASDISILSVHRFPMGQKLFAAKEFSAKMSQEIELELSLAAIKRGGFRVLGHPGGMSLTAHKVFNTEYFEEIIEACAQYGIAFDFNSRYHIDHIPVLTSLFTQYNPLVSIGSDAHRLKNIGSCTNILFGENEVV